MSRYDFTIRGTSNKSYILTNRIGAEEAFATLEEAFGRLLLYYEGRCREFSGEYYGGVVIQRGRPYETLFQDKEQT